MMVTISERFKFRPVKSRMSAFVDRFSMTKRSSESAATSKLYGGVVCRIDGCRFQIVGVDQIVVFAAII